MTSNRISSYSHSKIKGFTLIELMVVISIIGLLGSVILVSLNSARDKGQVGAAITFATNMYHSMGDQAVVYYQFDNDSGSNIVKDSSFFNNNGNFYSDNTANSSSVAGNGTLSNSTYNGTGYALDTTTGTRHIMTPSLPDNANETVALWIKSNTCANIFTSNDADKVMQGTCQWSIYVTNAYVLVPSTVIPASDNKWHHIAYTLSNRRVVTAYFDGKQLGSPTTLSADAITGTSNIWNFGRRCSNPNCTGTPSLYSGQLDDIAIYNRAVSAMEMGRIYAESKDRHTDLAKK